MIARPILENFRQNFLDYFQNQVLLAEFDEQQRLIVFVNPYLDFSELAMEICDNLIETVFFNHHLDLHLYRYGNNSFIKVSIN